MLDHKYTKVILRSLISFGYKTIGPVVGDMACGEYGEGKMSDPSIIFEEINNFFSNQNKYKKIKALVTAGPTKEYIDPIRFILQPIGWSPDPKASLEAFF